MSVQIYQKLASAADSAYTLVDTVADAVNNKRTAPLSFSTQYSYKFTKAGCTDVVITGTTVATPANVAPVVNAGADAAITLPTSSILLNGTATDSDGTIQSNAWSVDSKPVSATVTFSNAAITNPTASGLTVVGTYVLRLTATDDKGGTNSDTVQITVNPAGDTTAPVLQTAFARAENEDYASNQIVLPYNEALDANSLILAADESVTPANSLTSSQVNGSTMVLNFANPFPASSAAITLSTLNAKIKDTAGNAAALLTNQTILNQIGALSTGWTAMALPATPTLTNKNNFWRTSSTDALWGKGNRMALKLPYGTDGGVSIHYTKQNYQGFIGLSSIDLFSPVLNEVAGASIAGFYIGNGNASITRIDGGKPSGSTSNEVVESAVLGNRYRVWRTGTTVTLEKSSDGVNWTVIYTYLQALGDAYAIFDIAGIAEMSLSYPQYKNLAAVSTPYASTIPAVKSDVFYATTADGTLYNTGGIWKSTATNNAYGHTGLSNWVMPADKECFYELEFQGIGCTIALDSARNRGFSLLNCAYVLGCTGATPSIAKYNGGSTTGAVLKPGVNGYKYRIHRVVSGTITIEESPTGADGTWTILYTFATPTTQALYIYGDAFGASQYQLTKPKAYALP